MKGLVIRKMIYTVTFNPSIDYFVGVKDFMLGATNRTNRELMFPGGKGINVSLVLQNLGFESTALGFVGGFTGDEIVKRLDDWGCKTDFVKVKNGISRINVKIQAGNGLEIFEETEINGQGPIILDDELEAFYRKLDLLKEGDILVLSGSIPSCMPGSAYEDVLERVEEKGILCVVDATGWLLLNALKYSPFLIKPNKQEMEEVFGINLVNNADVIFYAKKLQKMGAKNVLVSMAGAGAVLVDETGEVYESAAPNGKVINSVGAGDSMVAGFLVGYMECLENDSIAESSCYEKAFKMGLAAGSASAFSERMATKEEMESILKEM